MTTMRIPLISSKAISRLVKMVEESSLMKGKKTDLSNLLNRGLTPSGAFSPKRYLRQITPRLEDGRALAYSDMSLENDALRQAARNGPTNLRKPLEQVAQIINAETEKVLKKRPGLKDLPSKTWNREYWETWGKRPFRPFQRDADEIRLNKPSK